MITQTRLKELFDYDPLTGLFTRKRKTAIRGHKAAAPNSRGYFRTGVDNQRFLTHRLIWLFVYGVWPKHEIDHKNRNNGDNRLDNLRDISPSENQHNHGKNINNSSGFTGVSWDAFNRKWVAAISARQKQYHLGRFDCPKTASEAYQAAKRIHHPTAPL